MGSSQSQEQMEKFQRGYIKESRMGHPYFGNHFLLINRNQHEMVILKQLVFHSSSQYQQFQREYQKIERKPFSLIYPRLIVKSGGIQTCSNIYEINAYFDLVGRNLAQTIKAEGCFNQNQTWFLLNELSKSLQILGESNRPHWAISPENIYQNAYQNYFLYDTFFVIGFDPQSFLMNKLQNNGVMTDKMRMILEKGLTVSQTEGFEEDCYCLGFVLLFALTAIHPTSLPKDSLQRAQAVKNILVQRRGMISQELIQIILMLTERETLRRMDNYQLRRLLKDKQSEIIRKQQQEFEKSRKKEVTPREGQTKQSTPKPMYKQIVISDMHPINHQSINRIIMPLNPTQRAPVLTPLGTFSEQAMKHPQLNQASRGHISNFGDYPSDRSNTLTRINSNDRLIPKR